MTTYSAEFKASIIDKMLPPNNANVLNPADETQIPKDTLYYPPSMPHPSSARPTYASL